MDEHAGAGADVDGDVVTVADEHAEEDVNTIAYADVDEDVDVYAVVDKVIDAGAGATNKFALPAIKSEDSGDFLGVTERLPKSLYSISFNVSSTKFKQPSLFFTRLFVTILLYTKSCARRNSTK